MHRPITSIIGLIGASCCKNSSGDIFPVMACYSIHRILH